MNRIFKNTPQTKTYRVVLLHLAGIAFVIGQHVLVMIAAGTPPTIKGYLTFLTEIAVFYTNLLWVVPLAFDQSRRVTFVLRVAVLILLYTIIRGYLSYRTDQKLGVLAFAFSAPSLLFTLWRLTYALGYSFFLGLYWHVQKRRREQITLKLAVADAVAQTAKLENVMIHLRLNPHLLLSTLEHVHANVEEKAPDTAIAIAKLIDITRYSFANMEGSKTVPAIEELRQVEEHITVKQLLAGNRLYVNFHNNIALDNHHQMTLPPGILLTLADNVLTHGKLTDPATPAVITAAVVDNRFCFTTANYKRLRSKAGNGVGLKSVQSVLESYCHGRYELLVQDTAESFTLKLIIPL